VNWVKVTFDTNVADRIDLVQVAKSAGLKVFVTSVTKRELLPSNINLAVNELVMETAVFGESTFDNCVLGSNCDAEVFEESLKILSNGSFPAKEKRTALSDGERRQLRDAMIFTAHVSQAHKVFVSDDERAFVRDGRRDQFENLSGGYVMTSNEFLSKYGKKETGQFGV